MNEVEVRVVEPFWMGVQGPPGVEMPAVQLSLIFKELSGERLCNMTITTYTAGILKAKLTGDTVTFWNSPHDTIIQILDNLGYEVKKVLIAGWEDDHYKATLVTENSDGISMEYEMTPPDAVIIAVAKRCPIYMIEAFLKLNPMLSETIRSIEALDNQASSPKSDSDMDETFRKLFERFDDKSGPKH